MACCPRAPSRPSEAVLDERFNAINHSTDDGGQGLDTFQQVLVEEEWGRATGALWDIPWRPSIPLAVGDRGAEGAVPASGVPRRATRRLRDHRGGGRARTRRWCETARQRDGDGWVDRRREVARDRRRRRGLLPGPRARRRRPGEGDRVPRRQGPRPASSSSARRSTRTRSCSSTRSSRSTACGSVTTRSSARSVRGSSSRRTGSSRSGS